MDVDWENVCQASVSTHFVDLACLLDRRVCISVDMVRPIFLFLKLNTDLQKLQFYVGLM